MDVGGAALTGSVQTKVAGDVFTLDLYAINGFGTGQNIAYTGAATVQVLNAADSSGAVDVYGCRSSWSATGASSTTSVRRAGSAGQRTGSRHDGLDLVPRSRVLLDHHQGVC